MKLGIDIGGTKCAVVLGDENGIIRKIRFDTTNCAETINNIFDAIDKIGEFDGIGISCGGPLDSRRGIIMSPPNLPDWDNVPITAMLEERYGVKAYLCNDANACALAEWKYGAGVGTKNMIFLTFGTGMGAGLILDGRLYEGKCGMAGEVGHVRMAPDGPIGYGKAGSFEGFCSGGGLAKIGQSLALDAIKNGSPAVFCPNEDSLGAITAKLLREYADRGDELALEAFRISGEYLGAGVSMLIDLFDPERIVIGSVFQRAEGLLRPHMERVIGREALGISAEDCRIVAAKLGDEIGDYAALSVAYCGGKQ